MEGLTRLVSESLARHGLERPLDYRRLRWSRWFRCESHHSLLLVPSQPGVFAVAEEIVDWETPANDMATSAFGSPDDRASTVAPRRMLAVTQFFEDDDMAFVLDRMLARSNPMQARLTSGRYFVRFVVIEDGLQRRGICNALNQWIANSAEKAAGIGSHFAMSLELTPATEYMPAARDTQASLFENIVVGRTYPAAAVGQVLSARADSKAPHLDSGASSNIHCPSPFPSGF